MHYQYREWLLSVSCNNCQECTGTYHVYFYCLFLYHKLSVQSSTYVRSHPYTLLNHFLILYYFQTFFHHLSSHPILFPTSITSHSILSLFSSFLSLSLTISHSALKMDFLQRLLSGLEDLPYNAIEKIMIDGVSRKQLQGRKLDFVISVCISII